jgi:hypothetical protein
VRKAERRSNALDRSNAARRGAQANAARARAAEAANLKSERRRGETGGFEGDFNQRPFDFDAAMAPARGVRLNFARDTSSHAAWRAAGAPEDDLQFNTTASLANNTRSKMWTMEGENRRALRTPCEQ